VATALVLVLVLALVATALVLVVASLQLLYRGLVVLDDVLGPVEFVPPPSKELGNAPNKPAA
jgi:hypothetical protein